MNDEPRTLARRRLGDERFRAAYAANRALPTDEAVDFALEALETASQTSP